MPYSHRDLYAADAQDEWRRIVEAAKKEGQVVAGGPPTAVLRKQFKETIESRFGIELELLSKPGPQNAQLAIAEFKAGVKHFDTAGQPERTAAVLRKQAAGTILTAPNTYAAEKQGLRKFSIIRGLGVRQLITITGATRKYLRERRDGAEAFSRGYVEGLAHLRSQRNSTTRVTAKYTRQRDAETLHKFYDEMASDLPRIPYVDEVSARATIDAMQAQGPPLPKVDIKGIFDNSLLGAMESSGLIDKLAPRLTVIFRPLRPLRLCAR